MSTPIAAAEPRPYRSRSMAYGPAEPDAFFEVLRSFINDHTADA